MTRCSECEAQLTGHQRKYCSDACKSRARYNRDPELHRQRARKYRQRNREVVRERDKARYKAEGEHRREYARSYYWSNYESVRQAQNALRAGDRKRFRELNRSYYQANKERFFEYARKRKHVLRGAKVVDFTPEQLLARLSMFSACWICKQPSSQMHIDHVKPISKGGPHMLANMRPACPQCNLAKGNKWPFKPEGWEKPDIHSILRLYQKDVTPEEVLEGLSCYKEGLGL